MLTLIQGADLYSPDPLGRQDILLCGNKIAKIAPHLDATNPLLDEVIDGSSFLAVPGFIDCHEHITGGGGEGGYTTRTPEVQLTDLTCCGVTTVVGCLGTDGVTRSMQALYAKACALEEEGISTFIYDGSYRLPLQPVTSSVMEDLLMIDKIIGAGEIAISDHRSSQPTFEEFTKLCSDVRVGGMLSGKAGIINVHLGDSPRCMDLIERVVDETEIPITQFLPTHTNRNAMLFEKAVDFAKRGGVIDFTANEDIDYWESVCDEVRVSKAIRRLMDEGVDLSRFTITSDGQGSLPLFDTNGHYLGLGVGRASSLLHELKDCVLRAELPLSVVLAAITKNPAQHLKLKGKGVLEVGADADLCLLHRDTLDVDTVLAKGQILVRGSKALVLPTFHH